MSGGPDTTGGAGMSGDPDMTRGPDPSGGAGMRAEAGRSADGATVRRQPREERPGDAWIVALLFALAFGYDTVEAVSNLQQLPLLYVGADIAASIPWWLLIGQVALPAVLFAAALWIGRRMRLVAKSGLLLCALAVSAQLSLLAEQLARQIAVTALGG